MNSELIWHISPIRPVRAEYAQVSQRLPRPLKNASCRMMTIQSNQDTHTARIRSKCICECFRLAKQQSYSGLIFSRSRVWPHGLLVGRLTRLGHSPSVTTADRLMLEKSRSAGRSCMYGGFRSSLMDQSLKRPSIISGHQASYRLVNASSSYRPRQPQLHGGII